MKCLPIRTISKIPPIWLLLEIQWKCFLQHYLNAIITKNVTRYSIYASSFYTTKFLTFFFSLRVCFSSITPGRLKWKIKITSSSRRLSGPLCAGLARVAMETALTTYNVFAWSHSSVCTFPHRISILFLSAKASGLGQTTWKSTARTLLHGRPRLFQFSRLQGGKKTRKIKYACEYWFMCCCSKGTGFSITVTSMLISDSHFRVFLIVC